MSPALLGEQLAIDFPSATASFEVTYIPRALILPDPEQPRKAADADLRASIARNGVLQPITVRPHPTLAKKYFLVDGERRWRGSEGILETLPCLVRDDQGDAALRLRTQLVANTGKPLTPLEEARAFAALLEAQGDERSIEQLSAELGRPVSSIHERLGLLELGPWIPWIEDGTIGLSHAVKVLLPLRGCAESAHLHAQSVVEKDYRFTRDEGGMSLSAFTQVAQQAYRSQLYPLTKTKASYEPQPLFDTKPHDAECDCGRVMFALGHSDAKRACCGNPAWWRPRDRKAKAAQPKKADTRGATNRTVAWSLPEDAATKSIAYIYDKPKGYTPLTHTHEPRWRVEDFDPTTLVTVPGKKLALIKAPGAAYVATSDAAAVEEARRHWRARWHQQRVLLLNGAWQAAKEKGRAYRVAGAGVGELLAALELRGTHLYDALFIARVPLPKDSEQWAPYDDERVRAAISNLTEKQQADVASVIAYLLGTKTAFPSDAVEKLRAAEVKKIEAKRPPWIAKPSPAKKGKRAKVSSPAVALEDDEALGEDDDWEGDE